MLQLHPEGPDLWDSILPEEVRKLPEELARVDELFDDPNLMKPFLRRFKTTIGRRGVPVATYLRLMYLKFRYKMGYETLVAEVSDSIRWRRFCRISYTQKVPDPSTLIKLTHKYGAETLEAVHGLILKDLVKRKIVRGRKIRTDTTVVASDIHYPTDPSLLWDGLRRMRQKLVKVRGSGVRLGRTMRKVKKLIFTVAQALRKRDKRSREKVKRINFEVIHLVRNSIKKVKSSLTRGKIRHKGIRDHLKKTLTLTETIAAQSEERLTGGKPTGRVVSLVDPEARPIKKGKLDKPVEFGRTAQVTQDASGYFTQYGVYEGNPGDTTLLPGIIETHEKQFPKKLKALAADMGFSSEDNHKLLKKKKVTKIGMAWRGNPPPAIRAKQKRAWFKAMMRFRAGIEGSLSFLSRKFGLKRSMFRGNEGTRIWVGWVVVAANLYRFGQGP
jgi:IS5 family transposase